MRPLAVPRRPFFPEKGLLLKLRCGFILFDCIPAIRIGHKAMEVDSKVVGDALEAVKERQTDL